MPSTKKPQPEAGTEDPPSSSSPSLVQPLYLDTRMLTTFVAALEGGVSYGSEVSRRLAAATSEDRDRSAHLGIPAIASFVGLGASAGRSTTEDSEEAEEIRLVRTHTAASLFIVLRDALVRNGDIAQVGGPADMAELTAGDFVQFAGTFLGNPLEEALNYIAKIIPFAALVQMGAFSALSTSEEDQNTPEEPPATPQQNRAQRRQQGRGGAGPVRPTPDPEPTEPQLPPQLQAVAVMVDVLQADLQGAAVVDAVLRTPTAGSVLLTLDRRYTEPSDLQLLRGSTATVLGKVTSVVTEPVSLLRRSAFSLGGAELAETAMNDLKGSSLANLAKELPDPTIHPPAIQVLPLAVFV